MLVFPVLRSILRHMQILCGASNGILYMPFYLLAVKMADYWLGLLMRPKSRNLHLMLLKRSLQIIRHRKVAEGRDRQALTQRRNDIHPMRSI